MNLQYYEGKKVQLTTKGGETFTGYATDYIFAEDNAPKEINALILDQPIRKKDGYKYEYAVEFTELDIQSIEDVGMMPKN